jgi:uncharacterized protein YcnI
MKPNTLFRRALVTAAAAATFYLGSFVGVASASAHVHVTAEDPVPGGTTILTFQVPNESEKGASTTALTVNLPNLSASADVMPGWTVKLDKDVAAGTVRAITWTAGPGAGIPPDQFELFQILVTLPDADSASFPAIQTYDDGTVVHWDQAPPAGGGEADQPVPTVQLTGAPGQQPDHPASQTPAPSSTGTHGAPASALTEPAKLGPDNVARALAGSALLVAAIGVGIALVRRGA